MATTEDAPAEDAITPTVDNSSIINDPESMTTPKHKGTKVATAARSPMSTSTIASLNQSKVTNSGSDSNVEITGTRFASRGQSLLGRLVIILIKIIILMKRCMNT